MRARIILGASVAMLAAGCGGGDGTPPLPKGRFLAASQSITPRVQLFGDPVIARVDVIVDRDRFDPERVSLTANFDPYEREGEVVRTERELGRYTQIRWEFNVRCANYDCLPLIGEGPPEAQPSGLPPPSGSGGQGFGERRTFTFDAARVLYDHPEKGTQRVSNVAWPSVQSISRLNFGDTGVTGIGFPFEASVTPLHEATYRVSPVLLGAGFTVGALALLGLATALVARLLRREPAPVEEESTPELTPLERALELVEWTRERSAPERREALEVLAVELETESSELANGARRLAWSSAPPATEAIDVLVTSARQADASSN